MRRKPDMKYTKKEDDLLSVTKDSKNVTRIGISFIKKRWYSSV